MRYCIPSQLGASLGCHFPSSPHVNWGSPTNLYPSLHLYVVTLLYKLSQLVDSIDPCAGVGGKASQVSSWNKHKLVLLRKHRVYVIVYMWCNIWQQGPCRIPHLVNYISTQLSVGSNFCNVTIWSQCLQNTNHHIFNIECRKMIICAKDIKFKDSSFLWF